MTSLLVLKRQMRLGPLTSNNIVGVIFFSSCAVISVLFLKIYQKFQDIMIRWVNMESILSDIAYELPSTSRSIYKRVVLTTIIYLSSSSFEHIFYLASEMYTLNFEIEFCNQTSVDPVEVFIKNHLKHLFEDIPFRYNHFLGFAMEYLNFSYTFYWNFLDLFIILICIGIAFLYEKMNWRLHSTKGLLMNAQAWEEIRYHYVQINDLVSVVNRSIGEMVIFACLIDGYFCLVQLLNITM